MCKQMKTKLFTLITMLMVCVGSMWGQTTTATYGKSNGNFYNSSNTKINSAGFTNDAYFVSNTTPAVTVRASGVSQLNPGDAASESRFGLNNGTNTFTISVPDGYIIESYSFVCWAFNTSHPTRYLTTDYGYTNYEIGSANTNERTISVTGVNKQSTSFTFTTTAWSPLKTKNFIIKVRKKFYEEEKTTVAGLEDGYYVVQGRSGGKSGFWYHDKSLGSRYFRMSTSSSPDLTGLTGNLKYVWKLTMDNDDATFTLQNVNTNAYAPADNGRNSNFTGSATANFSWDSEHAAIKQTNYQYSGNDLYVHCNQPSGDYNLSYWTTGPSGVNDGSQSLVAPRFFKIADVVIEKEFLKLKVGEVNDFKVNLGDGTGKYTTNATLSDINAEVESANALYANTEATSSQVTTEISTLQSYIDNAEINQPTPGYYRIKNKATSRYVNCTKVDNSETNTSADTDGDNNAKTIFYIDSDKDIQAYDNGAYWKGVYRMGRGTFDGGDYGTLSYKHPWQFVEGNSLGTYKLIYGNDTEGKYHATGEGEVTGYATLGSDAANADKATWTLVAITDLPARTEAGSSDRGNEITFAPAGTEVDENVPNVLVETSTPSTFICNNLQLNDDVIAQFTSATNFTGTNVTYTRAATTSQWGTIYLPYAPAAEEGVSYYELTASGENTLTFTKVETPAANTPYMYKKTSEGEMTATNASAAFTLGGDTDSHEGSSVNSYQLVGILTNSSIVGDNEIAAKVGYNKIVDPNAYYFKNTDNTFRPLPASNIFSMKAFRCYLTTSTSARQNVLNFNYEDIDQPTGVSFIESEDGKTVDVIFDLNGRRLQNAKKGISIINGKKVIK